MKNLKHLNDFDLGTIALGALRIGSLGLEGRKEALARVRAADVSPAELAKWVFEQVAHIATGDPAIDEVCGGPQVAPGAGASLSGDELSQFAEKYGLRFFGTGQRPSADDGQLRGIEYLVFQIRETNRAQQERHEKFLADMNRLQNDPTVKAMREFERINKLINPPQVEAIRHALEMKSRFDDMQKINAPFEDLRKRLEGAAGWKSLLEGFHRPNSIVEKFNSMFNADTVFTSALRQLQTTDSWRASYEHARDMYAHKSSIESFTRTQRAFHDIQSRWELPRQLIESVGALSALQEQIGRLTLPTLDWVGAAELARMLGPQGLQAQLSALGIDENGEFSAADETGERRSFVGRGIGSFELLTFIAALLMFFYQEYSSGKWQRSVDSKLAGQTALLEQQTKQLAALSILFEKTLGKEAKNSNTHFVALGRGAVVYRRPESGAPVDGRLLPREVVKLVSEEGKWIEVRYYHWTIQEYSTGWVLKKYLTRVPPLRQNDGE